MREFNIAGPCQPDIHYMLPASARLIGARRLVESRHYFAVHAPRQSGKTTSALACARELTASSHSAAVMASVEIAREFDSVERVEPLILDAIAGAAQWLLAAELRPPPWPDAPVGARIVAGLQAWAEACPRPLALFIDEVDALGPKGLSSLLSQLRAGFVRRPGSFPASIALVGMRDVRDYVLAAGGSGRRGAGSPFNVKTRSVTLDAFTKSEIDALVEQHTHDTGQHFEADALTRIAERTSGQPWLVNALARECVELSDEPVTAATVELAAQTLIVRNDTHLDSLAERLREARVRKIIEPLIAGDALSDVSEDDQRYVIELGLLSTDANGRLVVANPIYREVIPRALAATTQRSMPSLEPSWLDAAGRLDSDRLLDAYLTFWRQHGTAMMGTSPYPEVAAQLVTMAFMHRVVNGGGTVDREYAIASGRIDLCVQYGGTAIGIELKVWRPGRPDPTDAGLAQLDRYLDGLACDAAWLIVFDRRGTVNAPLAESEAATTPAGRRVVILRVGAGRSAKSKI